MIADIQTRDDETELKQGSENERKGELGRC